MIASAIAYSSFFAGFSGNSVPKRPITRLMIHRVSIVPPMPQISIVIPNVKLSIQQTLHFWPTFNVADAGITVGCILLAVSVLRGRPAP